ncbi:PREDICTED: testis-expressed sequence 12 protein [Chaetura pelagica]|uniref:testis-expressed sequence 12 protein n=1 Tax=Chaetura pelagica TaxID=8897 RepID=UPI0005237397|nr:PREDICTED: testis-expressed sequence 12 protein [Chaetura pelagica]
MASSAQRAEESRGKRRKEMENEASEDAEVSCLEKTDLALSEGSQSPYKPEPLDKVLNEMNKEIMNLLSKYAQILSERATTDASYVRELDGILKEARTLENNLKQKKESLKQRFAVLANTLQG